jgi:hypothetical protein
LEKFEVNRWDGKEDNAVLKRDDGFATQNVDKIAGREDAKKKLTKAGPR